ncbi:MAG: hypothetical protein IKS35_06950 [Clostridia bacterium]|nr:hypothetical protein [Clostridia bacterium]
MELVNAYMVFGGVPHYLNLIDPEFSLAQNIDNLFFKEGGQSALCHIDSM